MSNELKEYIVTLKSYDDLESFYDDMETPGGNLHIPNRIVDVANRRPISRNTHYYLTDSEAEQLRNDPRVLYVSKKPKELGLIAKPVYTQSSQIWDKSTNVSIDLTYGVRNNWGLLRCYNGQQSAGWGTNAVSTISGSIQVNQSGYNVDVVIVDGHFDPQLSELQKNSDGTGGSRVIQYNWFQHSATPGTYVYTPYVDPLDPSLTSMNNHGAHVAGIVAGNTQGWARNANIYNISYSYTSDFFEVVFDYIRAWHLSKPINPETGRRNPTIVNNSWGLFTQEINRSDISHVFYQGNLVQAPAGGFSISTLRNTYGIFNVSNNPNYIQISQRYEPVDIDVQDCIRDGIIMVGAAGNYSFNVVKPGEENFPNTITVAGTYFQYNAGASPGASVGDNENIPGSICVGSIDVTSTEQKADYSSCGTRVDIYAPGTNITSCVNSNDGTAVADPRGFGYLDKKSGTSMASPQVSGILACLAQVYPYMSQSDAIDYLQQVSKYYQIEDEPQTPGSYKSLQTGPNLYLAYRNERSTTDTTYPNNNYWFRPTSGLVWPRTNYRVV